MKNKKLIWAIIIVTTVLSLISFSFTYFSNQVESKATAFATKGGKFNPDLKERYLDSVWNKEVVLGFKYKDLKDKELKKGLDLQGGMQVTVEVSPVELVRYLSNNNTSEAFNTAMAQAAEASKRENRNFVDVFYEKYKATGKAQPLVSIFYNSNTSKYLQEANSDSDILRFLNNEIDSSIENANNIIRTRIDQFGTIQPNIQRVKGTNRIQIELPGENKAARIRDLIQSSAELNFWEVAEEKEYYTELEKFNTYLFEKERLNSTATKDTSKEESGLGLKNNDLALNKDTANKNYALSKKDTSAAAKEDSAAKANKYSTFFRKYLTVSGMGLFVKVEDTAKVNEALRDAYQNGIISNRIKFAYAGKVFESKEKSLQELVGKLQLYSLKHSLNGGPALNGTVVTNANFGYNNEGEASISMVMNDEGALEWKRVTGANVGKSIAIVLDDRVLSAPNVRGEIPNGYSEISGNYSKEEGMDLANKLKAGRMPAPVKIVEEAVVGPSLGEEAINQGLISSVVGALAVVIFMMMYYNKGGLVANLALLFNIFLIFGIMVQVPGGVVLTLPGIAGVVLTMGMSVDANVLIFERIREEIAAGKSVLEAIEIGYQKAFSSIFDSNVTTILTGFILALLGSGAVKGFAVTLIIGIVASFFTAVYVSRLILEYMARTKSGLNANSFSTGFSKNLFKNFNYNVIGNRKKA
ncbi:MAG TPA: protein translocase subunit SecD, partial [Cytophagales bacterium]|nr:protein translocase subunit SecD [Cytophagales bacterium]